MFAARSVALCAILFGFTAPVFAQDEEMPAFMTPGEEHKHLQAMVGTWEVAGKFFMTPGEPPTETKGRAVIRSILGGRYVTQQYESEMGDTRFEGFGLDGYDVLAGKYTSVWVDNHGTAIYTMQGTREGNVTTMFGDWPNPEGGMMRVKSVTTTLDDGRVQMDMFTEVKEGEWMQLMELVYKKVGR